MSELLWTRKLPTKPGWWWRKLKYRDPQCVQVIVGTGDTPLFYLSRGSTLIIDLKSAARWSSAPIPEPLKETADQSNAPAVRITDLDDLLRKITPLPWNSDTLKPSQGNEFWANTAYERHCCNTLPKLVEALELILPMAAAYEAEHQGGGMHVALAADALALAREVEEGK